MTTEQILKQAQQYLPPGWTVRLEITRRHLTASAISPYGILHEIDSAADLADLIRETMDAATELHLRAVMALGSKP
jgi:hypothetical protein